MQVSLKRMRPHSPAWSRFGEKIQLDGAFARRWFHTVIWLLVGALSIARFIYLIADFPNYSLWMIDQAKFTDEGWWASAAVSHALTGHWYVSGDYNPAIALPVWPALVVILFHFTGVSVVAARALNVVVSLGTLGVVFALVRRYTRTETPALIAVLLMVASPFAFAFGRLAVLDTLVVFEFCLLMLVASFASGRRIWPLVALSLLILTMMLTKTTAVLLVPAVFWVARSAMGRRPVTLLKTILAVGVVPAVLFKGYAALVARLGYGDDYHYFFDVNAMPDIDWHQTFATLLTFLQNCFWIDRVLYPVLLLILILTLAWKRKLWSNPLFAASWIALAAQSAFIFSRQDDYAPRYFLVMVAPLVFIVTLTFAELTVHAKTTAVLMLAVMAASVIANVVMIEQFLTHFDYDFRDAARGIAETIRSHPEQKPLILGVSGNQITLMTGIPSINDGFGTEDMAKKVASYQPGWYLAWNDISPETEEFLSPYRLEKMASYSVFDDDERSTLILYKMVRRDDGTSAPMPPAAGIHSPTASGR
jgi:4-amino-4-deoxy-L-arabinose transferase-like glycosyltransferase